MSLLAAGATAPSVATQLAGSGLIGLREGLEAGIVVMILVAFLVKSERRDALKWVWLGVGTAVAMVAATFLIIHFGTSTLDGVAAEIAAGIASLVAVVIVTAMVLWMRKASRSISGDLKSGMEKALVVGPYAVLSLAFFAVGREGLETALLMVGYAENTAGSPWPLIGLLLGIVVAAVVTVLMYLGAIRINMATFFKYTGVALVVVAAGILGYGVRALQIGGVLPGATMPAFDVSGIYDAGSWYGTVLGGILNLRPDPTVLQFAAWAAYLVIVLFLFLRPSAPSRRSQPVQEPAAT
ncbi:iron uptake transporter permease EfeU [Rhodococcus coprophilus]|uniref:Iron permease n=1 Tax=Rhodococcus coprophilus TaxID=38310 RepID=A0A2X4UAK7_9NOCA|nr:iron uptake transporter permease EfeU [Rhodococcus coprophilus]MBM7457494.1 high-affinity iron transporter [Rhodococcus coprophilus]SQI29840.1 iron permease [Rhodococcus coprophilus]